MAKTAFKLSTMVEGENFEMYSSQLAKSAFKLSTMVGENFEIYLSEMGKSKDYYIHGRETRKPR